MVEPPIDEQSPDEDERVAMRFLKPMTGLSDADGRDVQGMFLEMYSLM